MMCIYPMPEQFAKAYDINSKNKKDKEGVWVILSTPHIKGLFPKMWYIYIYIERGLILLNKAPVTLYLLKSSE